MANKNINKISYTTWKEFKANFIVDLFADDQFRNGNFIFRGQEDFEWSLVSSFDRWYSCHSFKKNRIEMSRKLLSLFKDQCADTDLAEKIKNDEILTMALAQHFGLPTRLLDWSESPYIAAFFAFTGLLDHLLDDETNQVGIWALNLESEIWDKDNGVEIVRAPSLENKRLRNQQGNFTISRTPYATLEEYVNSFTLKKPALIELILPSTETKYALADLTAMGITPGSLFPDLKGAALSAKSSVLLELT